MSIYKKTVNKLIKKNISVSTVESCTGGLLSYSFIKNSNISKVYKTGYITYSNESKINVLNVNKKILNKKGAVSKEVAKLLVENLFKKEKTMITISTTGIAGPTNDNSNKPIGLVYIGIKYKLNTKIYKKNFTGTRIQIQKKTIKFIFNKLNTLI